MPKEVIALEFDEQSLAIVRGLMPDLNARSVAEVLRKSLAFATVAVERAKDSDGVVFLRGKGMRNGVNVDLRR